MRETSKKIIKRLSVGSRLSLQTWESLADGLSEFLVGLVHIHVCVAAIVINQLGGPVRPTTYTTCVRSFSLILSPRVFVCMPSSGQRYNYVSTLHQVQTRPSKRALAHRRLCALMTFRSHIPFVFSVSVFLFYVYFFLFSIALQALARACVCVCTRTSETRVIRTHTIAGKHAHNHAGLIWSEGS